MTVTFTTLLNLTSAGQLSTELNTGNSTQDGVTTGGLVDANGNLFFFGTGGLSATVYEPSAMQTDAGAVIEIAKTATGYSSASTTLSQFNGLNGIWPLGTLIADSAGNLYGVTWIGGPSSTTTSGGYGTVFELAKTANGYASSSTVLAAFDSSTGSFPNSLLMDASGNLFGTMVGGGTSDGGSVFEIAKTATGYASSAITLVSFSGGQGQANTAPESLIADTAGDLFGIATGTSSVFEIAKTASGYASSATTIASFPVSPYGSRYFTMGPALVMDASGDLFGTALNGTSGSILFESAKTTSGYAAPVTLATLQNNASSLIIDSSGDLFGVIATGGANNDGVIFELAKTSTGYSASTTILHTFDGTTGNSPNMLFADASGNLFGTAYSGGTNDDGTLFEISGSGYTVSASKALSASLSSPATIGDSAANVQANLDGLETLAVAGKIASISLTDSVLPTITVTPTQLVSDLAALKEIGSSFNIDVTALASGGTITGGTAGLATTVVFAGTSSAYTVTPTGDGHSFTVTEGSAIYHLDDVTAIQFSDVTDIIASSTPASGVAVSSAQITNLYAAVFGRQPDVGGLAFYDQYAAKNPTVSITTYAQYFLSSTEYTGNAEHAYPQTSDGEASFITDTYTNLLHRAPEDGAVAFYQKAIAQFTQGLIPGTTAYTQADLLAHATVLTYFSQSTEFLADVQVTAQTPSSSSHWLELI